MTNVKRGHWAPALRAPPAGGKPHRYPDHHLQPVGRLPHPTPSRERPRSRRPAASRGAGQQQPRRSGVIKEHHCALVLLEKRTQRRGRAAVTDRGGRGRAPRAAPGATRQEREASRRGVRFEGQTEGRLDPGESIPRPSRSQPRGASATQVLVQRLSRCTLMSDIYTGQSVVTMQSATEATELRDHIKHSLWGNPTLSPERWPPFPPSGADSGYTWSPAMHHRDK